MNFLQRTLAVVSATGTAALMVLPAFAQTAPNVDRVVNNGDLNRNSGSLDNQAPYSGTTSDRCGAYINGGVGGPIDSQSYNQTSPSSYATASRGITGPGSSNQTMMGSTSYNSGMQSSMVNQPRYQFDANNQSAAIAYRNNGPAGTSGHESNMNLQAFQERQNQMPMAYDLSTPQASAPLPVACAPR